MKLLIDSDPLFHIFTWHPWQEKLAEWEAEGRYVLEDLKGKKKIPEYSSKEDVEIVKNIYDAILERIAEIQEQFFVSNDNVLIAIKSDTNYRSDLYSEYKANRNKYGISCPWIKHLVKKFIKEGIAVEAQGREADDYLRIWAEECRLAGEEYIIAANDKDLFCIPGTHWNIKSEKTTEVSEKEAMLHYYSQILSGDSTDNIPGLKGIGPAKAIKALEGCVSERHCQDVVVSMYIEKHGDDWKEYLLANGKLIHIQKSLDDYFTVSNWPIVMELVAGDKSRTT